MRSDPRVYDEVRPPSLPQGLTSLSTTRFDPPVYDEVRPPLSTTRSDPPVYDEVRPPPVYDKVRPPCLQRALVAVSAHHCKRSSL